VWSSAKAGFPSSAPRERQAAKGCLLETDFRSPLPISARSLHGRVTQNTMWIITLCTSSERNNILFGKSDRKILDEKQWASKTLVNYRKIFFLISVSHTTLTSKSNHEKMCTPCVLKWIRTHNVFGTHQPLETKPFRRRQNTGTLNQKKLVTAARVFRHCLITDTIYGLIPGSTDHP